MVKPKIRQVSHGDDWMIRQFAIEFAMHAIVGVGFARCRCEGGRWAATKRGEETLVGQFVEGREV